MNEGAAYTVRIPTYVFDARFTLRVVLVSSELVELCSFIIIEVRKQT